MDGILFDRLARRFATPRNRRQAAAAIVLGGVTALDIGPVRLPNHASARKRKKKVAFNAFGCVDVGRFCRSAAQCCSGICRGKKRKRRCRAHDTGGCPVGFSGLICANPTTRVCTTSTGKPGACYTTTGKAGYCGSAVSCVACTKDADCQAIPFLGGRAACVVCENCSQGQVDTLCTGPG